MINLIKLFVLKVLNITSALLFLLSLLGCLFCFWRIRDLHFVEGGRVEDESAELLDRILLIVGLVGELMFCIGLISVPDYQGRSRLLGNLMALMGVTQWTLKTGMLLAVQLLRLSQVLVQTALLTLGSKLHAEAKQVRRDKPGKQVSLESLEGGKRWL
jgi:hypothetical protein